MSISGEVTAPVVYAHSGNPEDYELAAQAGHRRQRQDRAGPLFESLQLSRLQGPHCTKRRCGRHPYLQRSGRRRIQERKSLSRRTVGPGEPHSARRDYLRFHGAGRPAHSGMGLGTRSQTNSGRSEAVSLPKIMALPLSWHDAKPLLENMGGPVAPDDWQGGLPIKYHLGGEQARVHLKIEVDNSIKPYYVVEARIRGSELPDEWVVLGNHRDAWVFGGVDPSSGTASMMEMTRSLGQLSKQGIRPRRTLVVCSWDGEEIGLTGSTEWGEQFADELRKKAVAYINVDSSTSGPNFDGSAVASLAPMLVETSHTLQDPVGQVSLRRVEGIKHSKEGEDRTIKATKRHAVTDANLADTRIGSGSDHTVFLNFVGMPVIGLGFDGDYGVYHSMYDNFYWMNHFGDPGYRYHTLMSQLWGVLALRLANADILPFDFASYASNIRQFVTELEKGKNLSQLDLKPVAGRNR